MDIRIPVSPEMAETLRALDRESVRYLEQRISQELWKKWYEQCAEAYGFGPVPKDWVPPKGLLP